MTMDSTMATNSPSTIAMKKPPGETDLSPHSRSQIQSLVGSWEKRVMAAGSIPDVVRLATSPRSTVKKKIQSDRKSTKQTMEDLAVFVSPREIKKKFVVVPKIPVIAPELVDDAPPQLPAAIPTTEGSMRDTALISDLSMMTTTTIDSPTPTPAVDIPKIGSIRDRMKAFERKDHANDGQQLPWMPREYRGKRGTTLDKFTPKGVAKNNVISQRNEDDKLPLVSLYQPVADEATEANLDQVQNMPLHEEILQKENPVVDTVSEDIMAMTTSEELTQQQPSNSVNEVPKIDRDTLVLNEIRKMIKDTEDNEIEDDMDELVKECLEKAALQSAAYTRRWYDALTDSWIHCPSLATIIMDFTLIEAAEVLYDDELPMLYTVSLRSVAAEVMSGEAELPEYVYRLAM